MIVIDGLVMLERRGGSIEVQSNGYRRVLFVVTLIHVIPFVGFGGVV